ncbi:HAD-IB family hydrolase [Streptomyces sp. MZ04]|uniref:HAD family hydrolase n=1 Tax=Streptomyces sp. MZ04 TaxID=2559236 RepID=UPI00107E6B56|nr:HAD-IB family hydrolase [Streptomyces sp. MZ04]TGA95335.1 HAD-IB family hydrolase [Streptomyces sp. MZ04]
MPTTGRAAFFDVDETIIGAKSMFDFLRFWILRNGGDEAAYQAAMDEFRAMWSAGVHRSEVNRAYYRGLASVDWSELMAAGRDWYADYRRRPDAFVLASTDALARHVADGDTVVLVSGSFPGCLTPLAEELRADLVLCSEPLLGPDGRLTGELRRPMIGDVKSAAIEETLARLGVPAADCFAYGDHSSDLGMLTRVGHPHVVGDDPVLAEQAALHRWPVLGASTGSFSLLTVPSDHLTVPSDHLTVPS